MFGRNKLAMIVAEFIGTFSLASVILSMTGRTSFPFFQAAAAGAAYGLMFLVFAAVYRPILNPALTFGLWAAQKIDTTRAVVFIAAQMLGGVAAWTLSEYLLGAPLKSIAGEEFLWTVFVAEALGALIFSFGVASALAQGYKGLRLAVTAGASLSVGVLLASFASNGSINPAVALTVQSWSVAYVLGPVLGALLGANLYGWMTETERKPRRKLFARVTSNKKSSKKAAKKRK